MRKTFGLREYCLASLSVWLTCQASLRSAENISPVVDVFVGGQEGFPTYRIPAIIKSGKGNLLAFAEGRASRGDHSRNKLVLKRSADQGHTWEKLQIIDDAGQECLNNPTAVLDRDSGKIILMYQRYPIAFDEKNVVEGLNGDRICRTFVMESSDEGQMWSKPQEITATVKRPTGATSLASGPGIGIQLMWGFHSGRILIPFNQGPPGHWQVYAAFSDDHGKTWHYGDLAPEDQYTGANEVQMVELADGQVLLNARNQAGSHQRRVAYSHDGGQTWSTLADEPLLIEPKCQASLIRHSLDADPHHDVLIFSNPASTQARTNGTIRLSVDEGKTWKSSRVLYPRSFAYSCLVSLDSSTVGCLFERDGYSKISFQTMTLDWINH